MAHLTDRSIKTMPGVTADGIFLPRRIRHVSSIRVCNFTPFPMRDAVTSALAQPVEPSQLNALGHLADDINMLSRRRSRKLSATSTNTKSSSRLEDDDSKHSNIESRDTRSRRTMTAGVSESSAGVSDASRTQYGSPQNVRRRRRTSSVASSMSGQAKGSILFNPGVSVPGPSSYSVMIPDISQQGLEKAITSRLIETFLTITILPMENQASAGSPSTGISSSFRGTTIQRSTSTRRTQAASISSLPAAIASKDKTINGTTKPLPSRLKPSHSRSTSSPMYQHNDLDAQPSTSSLIAHSSSSTPSNVVPDFFSRIHPPSVNPTFSIDARPGHDFSPDSNANGSKMKVQLWGRTSDASTKAVGKQKHKGPQDLVNDWSITQEWVFFLDQLLPLPSNASADMTGFPPNTLLVTLNPPGNTYYLSSTHLPASPPSPTSGYSSDPESASRRVERDGYAPSGLSSAVPREAPITELSSHTGRHLIKDGTSIFKLTAHTAAYQQLFELVNLHSLIQDHERTLSAVIQKTDQHFEHDIIFPLQREIYECQHRIDILNADARTVVEETAARKKELELRRHKLQERRQSLVSARILEETNISDSADLSLEAEGARERLIELHAKIGPTRIRLLSILASIYPIELYSPPDLLYTILGVPLPIPFVATEPAPPLSLPNHPNVNEDGVATALGYVAQLLHFLAAFLGRALVYPVTCVGSRSFIKDGISAMVGPRLFPLFSKGVETYRFEYGVFLLNKNIEMLMVDRDLQALDMRHTLPNLKNLVLTVTHGEIAPVKAPPPDSPALSMLELDSPTEPSATDVGSTTPKATALALDNSEEASTPPASGSTTPTVTAPDDRRSRPFLGLSFSELLRGRYPSTSRPSGKVVPEGSGSGSDAGSQLTYVPSSNDRGGYEGSGAHNDEVVDGIKEYKASSGDSGQVQNGSRHHDEAGVVANNYEEAATEPGTIPVHVH